MLVRVEYPILFKVREHATDNDVFLYLMSGILAYSYLGCVWILSCALGTPWRPSWLAGWFLCQRIVGIRYRLFQRAEEPDYAVHEVGGHPGRQFCVAVGSRVVCKHQGWWSRCHTFWGKMGCPVRRGVQVPRGEGETGCPGYQLCLGQLIQGHHWCWVLGRLASWFDVAPESLDASLSRTGVVLVNVAHDGSDIVIMCTFDCDSGGIKLWLVGFS